MKRDIQCAILTYMYQS